jgi:hypothetical protein
MGKHIDEKTKALCYFYRHPPPQSGIQATPYTKIPSLIPCTPRLRVHQVRNAVQTFHLKKKTRGRAKGFRKTTPAEDQLIMRIFFQNSTAIGELRGIEGRVERAASSLEVQGVPSYSSKSASREGVRHG